MTTASAVMVRVGDLKANGYYKAKTEFKNLPLILEMLGYLDFLSMTASFPSDDLEIPFEDGEIKVDRPKLNELFFSFQTSTQDNAKKSITQVTEEAQIAIKKALGNRAKRKIAEIEKTVLNFRNKADSLYDSAHSYLGDARRQQIEADTLKGIDQSTFIPGILSSIESSNWNFHRFVESESKLEFVNRTDVFLRYVNSDEGRDYSINCGKYRMDVYLNDMMIILARHSNNVTEVHMHPHCKSDNEPCYGNAKDSIFRAKISGDVGAVMKIIDSLLANYNPDSPYVVIERFSQEAKARDERAAIEYGHKQQQKKANKTREETSAQESNGTPDDECEEFIEEEEISDEYFDEGDNNAINF